MRVLIDTSVLIAAALSDHVHHQAARETLNHLRTQGHQIVVSGHSLAEMYSVLTRLPRSPQITASEAWQLIQSDVLPMSQIVSLSGNEYIDLLSQLASRGSTGGIVYDAIILKVAEVAQAAHLLTLNAPHFEKVNYSGAVQIVAVQTSHPTTSAAPP